MTEQPKLWADMTREEKGAILLARHEGKELETFHYGKWIKTDPYFYSDFQAYRVKPEPKLETLTMTGGNHPRLKFMCFGSDRRENFDTHRLSIPGIDGEPITGTYTSPEGHVVKVERIND